MNDIFISYKSERKLVAEHFAGVLRRHGYSVWFDYSLVKGKDFAEQIERQIRASRSLVVLWCSMSIGSRWVREEVHLAHDLDILIPVKIEPCDIPFGFRLADRIDLAEWDGNPRSHQLDELLNDLETKTERAAVPDRRALMEYEGTWRRFGAQPLKAFALGQAIEPDNGGLPSLSQPAAAPLAPQSSGAAAIHYEDASQRLIRSFTEHAGEVTSVAFAPDGRTALSGSYDGTLKLWDVSEWTQR